MKNHRVFYRAFPAVQKQYRSDIVVRCTSLGILYPVVNRVVTHNSIAGDGLCIPVACRCDAVRYRVLRPASGEQENE